jgi:hypothetical protein
MLQRRHTQHWRQLPGLEFFEQRREPSPLQPRPKHPQDWELQESGVVCSQGRQAVGELLQGELTCIQGGQEACEHAELSLQLLEGAESIRQSGWQSWAAVVNANHSPSRLLVGRLLGGLMEQLHIRGEV